MKTLGMKNVEKFLNKIVKHKLQNSLMIWGAPGIGKSSVVQSIADKNNLTLIDLRISQLAPTDLSGIPVPSDNSASWLPPDFLPTSGKGILFLEEINMAPPAVQGIAQQLILDRLEAIKYQMVGLSGVQGTEKKTLLRFSICQHH